MSVYHESIEILVSIFFLCQNRKLELSIDILFVCEVFPSDAVGVHKKYFAKLVQNPTLSAVLNNCSLITYSRYSPNFRIFLNSSFRIQCIIGHSSLSTSTEPFVWFFFFQKNTESRFEVGDIVIAIHNFDSSDDPSICIQKGTQMVIKNQKNPSPNGNILVDNDDWRVMHWISKANFKNIRKLGAPVSLIILR